MKSFKTPKGTELRIIDFKGKDYLEVQQRVIWFREEHPDWSIETEYHLHDGVCVCKAYVKNQDSKVMATGHKVDAFNKNNLEKAETGAIGRALALCGYGTQFAAEMDEGDDIADSPVGRKQEEIPDFKPPSSDLGSTLIKFGKFKGRMFKDIPGEELHSYACYLKAGADKDGKPVADIVNLMFHYLEGK